MNYPRAVVCETWLYDPHHGNRGYEESLCHLIVEAECHTTAVKIHRISGFVFRDSFSSLPSSHTTFTNENNSRHMIRTILFKASHATRPALRMPVAPRRFYNTHAYPGMRFDAGRAYDDIAIALSNYTVEASVINGQLKHKFGEDNTKVQQLVSILRSLQDIQITLESKSLHNFGSHEMQEYTRLNGLLDDVSHDIRAAGGHAEKVDALADQYGEVLSNLSLMLNDAKLLTGKLSQALEKDIATKELIDTKHRQMTEGLKTLRKRANL
ncbi:hypothetical protein PROFUN_08655 [Planoprotostelium fungivorum]|uniref:Uncharacterized protein n=1 Tax=Planoprotostelium fungivorum TaxID=1890364 RepID=A0A2P6NJ52_9EUKA|nr:hypothetical protein PROFUN_08655 [Planoprotostelium fungivorum]